MSKEEKLVLKRKNAPNRVVFNTFGKSRVEQHHKQACDINNIVSKYRKTGLLPEREGRPHYGDFTSGGDFQECMNMITEAEESFADLPSNLRKRFNNDPAALIDFMSDESNLDEAVKLGLVEASKAEDVKSEVTKVTKEKGSSPANPPAGEEAK